MSLAEVFTLPEAAPFLLLVPLVWLTLRTLDRRRGRRLAMVVGARVGSLAGELSLGQRRFRRWLSITGLLLALVAVLQPTWGEGVQKLEQRGVDVLVCLDVSRSMLARDLDPDRLSRAIQEIHDLAARARSDRLGLVAFAGEARLVAPLTRDLESFAELVDLTGPLAISRGGTDLGSALEVALEALQGRSGQHEVVVLLTDGEDLEERGLRVAELCRDRNVTVHCVGLGSAQGSKITVESQGRETFLRDQSGAEVVSAMNPSSLRAIAEATGGTFLDSRFHAQALTHLYETRIVPMASRAFDEKERRGRKNRFQWPLLAAFALWILELCLTDRRRS